MRSLLALIVLFAATAQAGAAAWTQKRHHWQVFSSVEYGRASKGFDAHGAPDAPIKFEKEYTKTWAEWGWNDRLTLILAPEYSIATSSWNGGAPVQATDMGAEAGARWRVSDAFGVLALQSTLKYAGPFDLSHGPIQKFGSNGRGASRSVETRLLYGTSFKILGRDGFVDVESAERFISAPRPNETDLDLTAGLWFGKHVMAMAQSFNVISGGEGEAPYTYFRAHKVVVSVVACLNDRWSVQLGAFTAVAGQNTVVEQGLSLSLWHFR